MATYKVIQDIEAEDKLLGPLTLRQFIYAGIAAILLYLTYLVISKGLAFMAVVFVPFSGVFAFFAWPWSRDQPTEIWALAKIRFLVKPRKRIWDQSGVKELVTITAPKKVERVLTNGLSQTEVNSRLKALADTIDSRGWAIKNVDVNLYAQPSLLSAAPSDRLINIASLPQAVPAIDIRPGDDMLDEQNNPLAQQMQDRLAASNKEHRQKLLDRLRNAVKQPEAPAPVVPLAQQQQPTPQPVPAPQPAADYWFLNQPSQPAASVPQNMVTFNTQVVAPGTPPAAAPVVQPANPTPDETQLLQQLTAQAQNQVDSNSHLHVIQPLSAQRPATPAPVGVNPFMQPGLPPTPVPAQTAPPQVTQQPDAAILDLARNDDLNVATLAREAHKRRDPPQDEVVISLH